MKNFQPGQVWISEAEPELGLGFVREQDLQSVVIEFPSAGETRRYGKRSAPVKRLQFRVGDTITPAEGEPLVVERLEARDGLIWYIHDRREVCESALSSRLKLERPLQRFLAGHLDPLKTYLLRRRTLEIHQSLAAASWKGLLGPRVQLLPHQLCVVDQVSSRGHPRALLADEVGLGKTIEAGWILHRLALQGRVRRALVLAPKPLLNQWFVELLRRFNLSFWVPESQGTDPRGLGSHERVILSFAALAEPGVAEELAAAGWDLVIVDEAHRVGWSPGAPSGEYLVLEKLAAASRGLLLLTATPEQLGLEGHFARLRLIDPARFPSWEGYLKEHERYREVAARAATLADLPRTPQRRAELLALIDRYGTGRAYFRNSRKVVEAEHCFFPKRRLRAHRLDDDPVAWLGAFARGHRDEKTLLICATPAIVAELEKRLKEEFGVKAAGFHEKMPLLARDRAAAWFEDPEGASILLASEIGGEGRNFQHARHLIMADLPADPDVLEQRIGRLDRIGQANDIEVHVPYRAGTREELLLRWHNEVFHAFDAATKGAGTVYERHRGRLDAIFAGTRDVAEFDGVVKSARADYLRGLADIEEGRDRLVEANSFDAAEGAHLASVLKKAEDAGRLREYLERVLDVFGVSVSDLDADSLFVEGGDSMYESYFPALPAEGLGFTFSREKALAREDLAFMTWEHPMLAETIETIVAREAGNAAAATWGASALAARPELASTLLIECFFILEAADLAEARKWLASEFSAPAPVRIVIDGTGKDITARHPREELARLLAPIAPARQKAVHRIPPEAMRKAIELAHDLAEDLARGLRADAAGKMRARVDPEVARLRELAAAHGFASAGEADWWEERGARLEELFANSKVRLDSFLLVVPPGLLH